MVVASSDSMKRELPKYVMPVPAPALHCAMGTVCQMQRTLHQKEADKEGHLDAQGHVVEPDAKAQEAKVGHDIVRQEAFKRLASPGRSQVHCSHRAPQTANAALLELLQVVGQRAKAQTRVDALRQHHAGLCQVAAAIGNGLRLAMHLATASQQRANGLVHVVNIVVFAKQAAKAASTGAASTTLLSGARRCLAQH